MASTLRDRGRPVLIALVVASVVAGCTAEEPAEAPDDAASSGAVEEPVDAGDDAVGATESEPDGGPGSGDEPDDADVGTTPENADVHDEPVGDDELAANEVRALLTRTLVAHTASAAAVATEVVAERHTDAALAAADASAREVEQALAAIAPEADVSRVGALLDAQIQQLSTYAVAVGDEDVAAQEAAIEELVRSSEDLAARLEGEWPTLPADVSAAIITEHALSVKDVVDLRAADDRGGAFAALRDATAHADMLADTLTTALVADVDGVGPASDDLTVTQALWTTVLTEHATLVGAAVLATVDGDEAEAGPAAAALDASSNQWADIVAATFPELDRDEFHRFWDGHTQVVGRYVEAVVAQEDEEAQAAADDLAAHAAELGAAFSSLIGDVDADDVAAPARDYVTSLRAAVDAAAADDRVAAHEEVRRAAEHLQRLAEVVTAAAMLG